MRNMGRENQVVTDSRNGGSIESREIKSTIILKPNTAR
jgi:hypothetical protein